MSVEGDSERDPAHPHAHDHVARVRYAYELRPSLHETGRAQAG